MPQTSSAVSSISFAIDIVKSLKEANSSIESDTLHVPVKSKVKEFLEKN